ncbi:MAG: endonuclease III [Chloroflexi bacterium]|nr:endonuclease III [Chloroflexota bacterium]
MFTILSQHTSDVNALKAYQSLLDALGPWERVAQAESEDIARAIWIGGLSRVKAPRIKAVLQAVQEKRGNLDLHFLKELPLPEAKAWLRELPGVGPKTAAIVLCFALGMPAMPVDTHIYRVSKRLGFIGDKTSADQAHDILEGAVAPEQVFAFHVYLITHGRRVCKARRPMCQVCVLKEGCPSAFRVLR